MRPVVTVAEMRAIDAEAGATTPGEVLVARAGRALARQALDLLGGGYGRRVVVVAGKGNNGNDGRVAAHVLGRRGVRVRVVDAGPASLPVCDLVVDAAYGTGFRGAYEPPDPGAAPVLACDIPSGIDGDSGAGAVAVRADHTVTFAALKPGLLLNDGPEHAGQVSVADIGLDVSRTAIHLVEDDDVRAYLPGRPRDSQKYDSAVQVVAGSPGMQGAARFVSRGAMRAGAGYVRLASPGVSAADLPVGEAVGHGLPTTGWDADVLDGLSKVKALALGPGLGRGEAVTAAVRGLLAKVDVPTVVDADGLNAIGDLDELTRLAHGSAPMVVTPHEGEFARLTGEPLGADRIGVVRSVAARTGAVVLLKGATTVVAAPDGQVLLAIAGTPALATAGSGDVLTGVIAAFLACGLDPLPAAALAAHVHGRAARAGWTWGLVAGDLPDLVAQWLSSQVKG